MTPHERASRLNWITDRCRELRWELLHEQQGKSWQWVRVRKNELDELLAEEARLTRRLT